MASIMGVSVNNFRSQELKDDDIIYGLDTYIDNKKVGLVTIHNENGYEVKRITDSNLKKLFERMKECYQKYPVVDGDVLNPTIEMFIDHLYTLYDLEQDFLKIQEQSKSMAYIVIESNDCFETTNPLPFNSYKKYTGLTKTTYTKDLRALKDKNIRVYTRLEDFTIN